jgi:hypothetical protein
MVGPKVIKGQEDKNDINIKYLLEIFSWRLPEVSPGIENF